MRRTATAVTAVLTIALACGACESSADPDDSPRPTASTTSAPSVSEHESGPQSPIAYGLEVPRGATQLGPLVRYRSARLIATYKPDLDAALAQEKAEEEKKLKEDEENGTPSPSPSPSPTTRPSEDTYSLLDEPPRADVVVSFMRIDGSPTEIVRRMAAQINAVIPTAKLRTNDISTFCQAKERRVTGCRIEARGATKDDRDLRVTVTVDPGDLATRSSYPSDERKPVMTLTAEYLGDPREGQVSRPETVDVPRDVKGSDTSDLIWPRMDLDEPRDDWSLAGWKVPDDGAILLSGDRPGFAAIATTRVGTADEIAQEFARSVGTPRKDVLEDLNEIVTTYTATGKKGTAVASFVLSARGNYAMLSFTPRSS
ncbi:MAG: hypothetical protein PGN07_01545 [Aeromicrobium erythreum]